MLLALLVLLCLRYGFAADPRVSMVVVHVNALCDVAPHLEGESRIHPLRKLYEFRLAVVINMAPRWRSFAGVVSNDLYLHTMLLLLGDEDLAAPTQSPALRTVDLVH